MKKRIAIWILGGIGNGNFSQGYPMLEKLIDKLCDEFVVVVYSHTPPNDDYQINKIILKYPPRSIKSAKIRWVFLSSYFFIDYWKKKFDIIIAFWGYPIGFFVVILSKLLGIPSVVSVLGADSSSIKSINYGIFHKPFPRFIATWSYEHATVLLTISDFQKQRLQSFGIKRHIKTIPWGADSSMYKFSKKKAKPFINIIHVGHINPVKDQVTLLKAFDLITKKTPARLTMYGLDTMDGAMGKVCIQLGISDKVDFVDMVPYHLMPQHYSEADMMLHTSLSEGQCMALTEAAACGVLMAGTNVGILHDLGEACGVVVDVGDYKNLARKVLVLIEHPDEWLRRVQNAKKWSELHDLNWTINQLTQLLKNL